MKVIVPANCFASPSISCKLGLETQKVCVWGGENIEINKCKIQFGSPPVVHEPTPSGTCYVLLTQCDEGQSFCSQYCLVDPRAFRALPLQLSGEKKKRGVGQLTSFQIVLTLEPNRMLAEDSEVGNGSWRVKHPVPGSSFNLPLSDVDVIHCGTLKNKIFISLEWAFKPGSPRS